VFSKKHVRLLPETRTRIWKNMYVFFDKCIKNGSIKREKYNKYGLY